MSSVRQIFESMEERIDPIWRREIHSQFDANSAFRRIVPGIVLVVAVGSIFLLNGPNVLPTTAEQSRRFLHITLATLSGLLAFLSILSIQSKNKQGWFIPDKDSKALFFLLSTPISSTEVVLSNLIPAWWDSVLVLLMSLPLMVIGMAFDFWNIGTVVLLYFIAIITIVALRLGELQASIHAKEIKGMRGKRPFDSTFFLLAVMIVSNSWPSIMSSNASLANALLVVWNQAWVQCLTATLVSISPWGPLLPLLSVLGAPWPVSFNQPQLMLAISLAARVGFTGWTLWRTIASLRPIAIRQMLGEPSERVPQRKRLEEFLRRVRPPVWEDYPIAWRKIFIGRNSVVRGTFWMLIIVSLTMPFIPFLGVYNNTGIIVNETLAAIHFFTTVGLFFVFIRRWVASQELVPQEKRSETWISILATPLSNAQLVRDLLLPSILSAASTMFAILLVVASLLLFRDVGVAGMTSLPIVIGTWLVLLAACAMMVIVNSTPKEQGSTDVLVWTVGILAFMFSVFIVTSVMTFTVAEACRGFDDDLTGISAADSLTATGFLWCRQTTNPGEFTWRAFVGVPAFLMYLLILQWFWPRCVRRFGVVNERRD